MQKQNVMGYIAYYISLFISKGSSAAAYVTMLYYIKNKELVISTF